MLSASCARWSQFIIVYSVEIKCYRRKRAFIIWSKRDFKCLFDKYQNFAIEVLFYFALIRLTNCTDHRRAFSDVLNERFASRLWDHSFHVFRKVFTDMKLCTLIIFDYLGDRSHAHYCNLEEAHSKHRATIYHCVIAVIRYEFCRKCKIKFIKMIM